MKSRNFRPAAINFKKMNKLNQKSDTDLVRDFHTVWHPCTQMKDHESVPPLLIERGEGVYLYDRDGNKYLDVISSWWVNLFGHNYGRAPVVAVQVFVLTVVPAQLVGGGEGCVYFNFVHDSTFV